MRSGEEEVLEAGGTWRIRADPGDVGLSQQWWGGTVDASWRTILLPAAWQTVLGDRYDGVAWLRRALSLPDDWVRRAPGDRLLLRFDAVATACRAWVNGVEVGGHVGDYAPFQLDVTAAAGDADALDIALRVDQIPAPRPEHPGSLQHGHVTKGFHDVLSLAHGGVWGPIRLARTGPIAALAGGASIVADASGRAVARVELDRPGDGPRGHLTVAVRDRDGRVVAETGAAIAPCDVRVETPLTIPEPRSWSPDDPYLYDAELVLHGPDGAAAPSERHALRFGCRTVETRGHHILLNDAPLFLRGVLHWGHEPETIAPAPSPRRVRDELLRIRAMGFNAVCLCMWYPPEHFFEIADELGVLVWQEHPVWQSSMRDEDLPEYRRQFESFMRRDRRHTSVVIVSATCEHPSFHPGLAAWWWERARRELPGRLLQVQTAFFRWADAEHADLHDEHTYDNSNRWVSYVEDLQDQLDRLPAKPFVMGETVLFTSWPDVEVLAARCGDARPWWLPRAFDDLLALQREWVLRYGREAVERFRGDADRFHLLSRRFQVEQLRRFPRHAGLVMNHIRDVPACQCGFKDDLEQWRFVPLETRSWLADRALLLLTPDHRRGFVGRDADRPLACRAMMGNFTATRFEGPIVVQAGVVEARAPGDTDGRVEANGEPARPSASTPHRLDVFLRCDPGEVCGVDVALPLPRVERPTPVRVALSAEGAPDASWDLWSFPEAAPPWPAGAVRLEGLPFTAEDAAPDDVERAYSRGYGLEARRWRIALPDPARLASELPAWPAGGAGGAGAAPRGTRVVLTHRLTTEVVDHLRGGGRVVLLASKAPGGLGAVYESLYGQVPFVVEEGPLATGDAAWIVDMLVYDLMRSYCRVIPVEALGIADQVDPIVRLVFTHDQPPVRVGDVVFRARVGDGLLVASSLDHGDAAGRHLLRRLVAWAAGDHAGAAREIDPAFLSAFAGGA